MPNKYIYKGGELEPSLGVARAAVAHLSKYGVFKVCQDGSTVQTIPLVDVQAITGNKTLTTQESGKVLYASAAAGLTITLPKASYGKMVFKVIFGVDVTSNQYRITPNSADTINIPGVSKSAGNSVDIANTADGLGKWITLVSDGGTNWYTVDYTGTWT